MSDGTQNKLLAKTEQLAGHVHGAAVSLNEAAQELAELKRRALAGEWIFKGNCPNCAPALEEVARLRAELSTVLAERDGLQSMLTQQGREANDHAERLALLQSWAEECGISPEPYKLVTRLRENRANLEETRGDRIRELNAQRDEARCAAAVAEEQRDTAEGKAERLEEELADTKEQHEMVVADRCPSDERHCGCVSFLRRELAELRSEATVDAVLSELGLYRWPRWIGHTLHTDESVSRVRKALGIGEKS